MEEKQLTGRELEEQANALLAEADFEEIKLPKKAKRLRRPRRQSRKMSRRKSPPKNFRRWTKS